MSEHHLLKTLLNIHLASDTSAVLHLPFILNLLTPESFSPSSHLPKWTARIQSLLHSKDTGGRWVGLVLAQKTGMSSQSLLLENSHAWVGVALPLLSKNDPVVVLKAAIRLLKTIFVRAYEASEFRRQVATPSIPKLLATLIPLVEQTGDVELKAVAMRTLANLIPLYPTLHKASYPALSSLALRFLDGHPHAPVPHELLSAASRLYSMIHVTGGKVGASSLWKKTLDETLSFGTNAFWSLRTTFVGQPPANVPLPPNEDPVTFVPLQNDRLDCAVTILIDLLGATVYRPVQLPLGAIVRFAVQLLRTTDSPKKDGFVDPITHSLELSLVPRIQILGCSLISSLAKTLDSHLYPYRTQILTALAVLLERNSSTSEHRHIVLHTLETVLDRYPSSHSLLISPRLMKAALSSFSRLLTSSRNVPETEASGLATTKNRKGKRKAQVYEGEELFWSARTVICPTGADGKVLLTALEVVRLLLRDPHLSAPMQSISIRVLIAVLLTISQIPPASLSPDPGLYQEVVNKLHNISTEIASGTSSTLSKSLPLIVAALCRGNDVESQRQLDLLLHPRLPPLIRSTPLTENLTLVFSEESDEEAGLRKSLGLYTTQDEIPQRLIEETDGLTILPSPQLPKSTAPLSTPAPPKSMSSMIQPAPVPPPLSKGKEKAIAPPDPILTSMEVPSKEQLTPFHSSVIEAPKPRSSQPPEKNGQLESSSPAPKYTLPAVSAEDEDEEMPAIDLDSDSEFE
ncbi:hypothetical protein D9756_000360 [Leucocoprinus leucothites]|uniref:Pre-rRNA-processing protein RIX1 n=1 Tax=Leucocoprinus leucothites TaxID=201217 RepID=A0A8H5GES6_9AGAR|nr:hypothetical protein D9756_000360 [Leucoagaricus leucothites]